MHGTTALQCRTKFGQAPALCEPEIMAGAMAVGSTEAKGRQCSTQVHPQHRCPQAFAVDGIMADPDRLQDGMCAQIIDMPMWPKHRSAMMRQACRRTARSKGTANIDRPTGFQPQPVAATDCNFRSVIDTEPQGVGSRLSGGPRRWSGHFSAD